MKNFKEYLDSALNEEIKTNSRPWTDVEKLGIFDLKKKMKVLTVADGRKLGINFIEKPKPKYATVTFEDKLNKLELYAAFKNNYVKISYATFDKEDGIWNRGGGDVWVVTEKDFYNHFGKVKKS